MKNFMFRKNIVIFNKSDVNLYKLNYMFRKKQINLQCFLKLYYMFGKKHIIVIFNRI